MSSILYSLPLLACPVGMGLMMWLMMRGKKRGARGQTDAGTRPDVESPASVELLREEHRRLGEHIDTLEQADKRPTPTS